MLKKHTLQVRLVKTNDSKTSDPEVNEARRGIQLEQINSFLQETTTHLAITFVAVATVSTALKIVKETAIITAETKIK